MRLQDHCAGPRSGCQATDPLCRCDRKVASVRCHWDMIIGRLRCLRQVLLSTQLVHRSCVPIRGIGFVRTTLLREAQLQKQTVQAHVGARGVRSCVMAAGADAPPEDLSVLEEQLADLQVRPRRCAEHTTGRERLQFCPESS